MPEPNIPLLRKAVEWVEQQASIPEIDREWNQATYISGPAVHASRLMLWFNTSTAVKDLHRKTVQVAAHCGTTYCVAGYIGQMLNAQYIGTDYAWIDDENMHVSAFAIRELGLTNAQAAELFSGMNSAEDVRRIAEEIAGGPL